MSDRDDQILDESIRPWGIYRVLEDSDDRKIKIITVDPNHRLSLQSHTQRSEFWYVLRGSLTVEKGLCEDSLATFELSEGESIKIPCGWIHRASNRSLDVVEFLEVQTGEYFGEDDIIRYEDDYGRVG